MKFTVSLIMAIVLLTPALNGQKVITNPDKPANPTSGRIIVPQKVMEISGDSDDFFFKNPDNINIGSDGSIFVADEKEILKFSPEGRFCLNYYKDGQGPAEATSTSGFIPLPDNTVAIHNQAPNKVMTFDSQGKLISEVRIPIDKQLFLFLIKNDAYYFYSVEMPDTMGSEKILDVPHQFLAVAKNDFSVQKTISLPIKTYLVKAPGAGYISVKEASMLSYPVSDNSFYVSHTSGYGIKLMDLEKKEIIAEFSRKYKRVPVTKENIKYVVIMSFIFHGKYFESPTPEYLNDIQSLHVVNNKLLVITSTTDKQKGVLIDVFDESGKYTDCFFFKFPNDDLWLRLDQRKVKISGDALFAIEQDKDENWMISKYTAPFTELLK
ncbi:MAG: hypothetical protein NT166_32515 [Candidatus Aminicenantes bacterium]|nr:hypothetical protein [Candidatus Aminicenantes bacterium]